MIFGPRTGQEGLIKMIEVTEAASKAIKAFMEERQLSSALRVYLQAGG
jgi:Fe-S cluster assembly iron-binding protein IscA